MEQSRNRLEPSAKKWISILLVLLTIATLFLPWASIPEDVRSIDGMFGGYDYAHADQEIAARLMKDGIGPYSLLRVGLIFLRYAGFHWSDVWEQGGMETLSSGSAGVVVLLIAAIVLLFFLLCLLLARHLIDRRGKGIITWIVCLLVGTVFVLFNRYSGDYSAFLLAYVGAALLLASMFFWGSYYRAEGGKLRAARKGYKACPKCGKKNAESAMLCASCGAYFDGQ